MSILGLEENVPWTIRLTFDNGETIETTTEGIAAVIAWDGAHTVTGVEIAGIGAEEIESAVDLPFDLPRYRLLFFDTA